MEAEHDKASVILEVRDGERYSCLKMNREPESWIDQLKHGREDRRYKNRKTSSVVSIYRVPQSIKCTKPAAYDPLVISLGAFHQKREPTPMDEYKLQAVDRTLERIPCMTREGLVVKVKELEKEIKDCYEDSVIEWDGDTLAWIMTIDACFILEFLRMDMPNSNLVFDPDRDSNVKRREIMIDIMKMENQVPFCILKRILELESKDPVQFLAERLSGHSMWYYFCGFPFQVENVHNDGVQVFAKLIKEGPVHLLDLSRQVIAEYLSSHSASGRKADHNPIKCCAFNVQCGASTCIATPNRLGCFRGRLMDRFIWLFGLSEIDQSMIPSAVKLRQAGIQLRHDKKGKFHFERRCFRSSILYIPQIIVDDSTDIFLRNLIALEECQRRKHSLTQRVVSRNVIIMDSLIDSGEDVELFRKGKIIKSYLGSDEAVAQMFNALAVGITEVNEFSDVWKDVHEHYNSQLRVWITELRKEHCSSPWYAISLLAAGVLVVLTLLQTIYTMKTYFEA